MMPTHNGQFMITQGHQHLCILQINFCTRSVEILSVCVCACVYLSVYLCVCLSLCLFVGMLCVCVKVLKEELKFVFYQ